jgi:hypothetical protein
MTLTQYSASIVDLTDRFVEHVKEGGLIAMVASEEQPQGPSGVISGPNGAPRPDPVWHAVGVLAITIKTSHLPTSDHADSYLLPGPSRPGGPPRYLNPFVDPDPYEDTDTYRNADIERLFVYDPIYPDRSAVGLRELALTPPGNQPATSSFRHHLWLSGVKAIVAIAH